MIQRVQSIFLFLAAACGFGVLALPFATTSQPVAASAIFSDATYSTGDHIALLILFGLSGALVFISIFLFKKRQTQLRVCRLAIIANVIGIVLMILLLIQDDVGMDPNLIQDGAGAYLPFGFIIFGLFALRFIRKDEELIRDMDRLR